MPFRGLFFPLEHFLRKLDRPSRQGWLARSRGNGLEGKRGYPVSPPSWFYGFSTSVNVSGGFNSRNIGHVAARAHLGPCEGPKAVIMKFQGNAKLTRQFRDIGVYEM